MFVKEERTQKTIEVAHIVLNRHGNLVEVDLQTAESTARLVNSGKIDLNLLLYLTMPRAKLKQSRLNLPSIKDGKSENVTAAVNEREDDTCYKPSLTNLSAKSKKRKRRKNGKSNPFLRQISIDETNRNPRRFYR